MAKTRTPSKATRPKANTVKWWLMKLPEPIRSKALKACDNPDRKVNSVAHAIADGFSWCDTKEGDAYWIKVRNRAEAGEFSQKKAPSKSKTKAPKKKPTQLDRIERSIGLIESKLATLNAWEALNEAMSEAKLASPTVEVEEKWVPKVNELVVSHGLDQHVNAKSYAGVGVVKSVFKTHWHVRWPSSTVSEHSVATTRPATSEEIAAHEAKLKAEAQAAEDAKLVFGARVKMVTSSREGFLMGPMCDADNDYRVAIDPENGFAQVVYAQRNEFTLLP